MSQLARFFATSGPGAIVETLTGNVGGPVPPTAGNINVVGDGVSINVVGNPGTSTLTISQIGGPGVVSITGNTGPAQTGAINLVTANSIPIFAGAAGTITLDFALTDNLLLGSSGSITTGNTNVGYGKLAAASISSGSSNSFIGYESGVAYTTGSNSTAVGAFSMLRAVAGASNNTSIGYASLSNLAGAGTDNTIVGLNAGTAYTTTESNNVIIGENAGLLGEVRAIRIGNPGLPSGAGTTNNIFIGNDTGHGPALSGAYTSSNIGIGAGTLKSLSGLPTGGNNVGIGDLVLQALTTGGSNISIGTSSLKNCTTAGFNIALGVSAGVSYTTSENSNILFNHNGILAENNTLRIGSATGTSTTQLARAFICGIDGVNVGSVAKVVTMASDQLGTATITAGTGVTVTPTANTITVATNTSAGNWVLIQSQIANNTSPNLDFTTGITSTYSSYAIIVSNLIPSLQANLFLLVSATGGAPYIVAGYQGGNAGVNTVSGAFSSLFTAVTTGFLLSDNVAGGSAFGSSGTYFLHGLTNGSEPMFTGTSFYDRIGNNWMTTTGGVVTTTNINALRVTASAGNLVSGRVTLYGIKEF